MSLTITEIEKQIAIGVKEDYRVCYTMDQLKFTFGFKRLDGMTASYKMVTTGKTEEQVSMLPLNEIRTNIENWAREKGYRFEYSIVTDSYTFSR